MSPGPSTEERTEEAVLATVTALLVEVIGAEYALGLDIDMDTSFQEDLELESIEFVTLSELLLDTYGQEVDFSAWLASMDVDQIIAMTVGELVRYITVGSSDKGE